MTLSELIIKATALKEEMGNGDMQVYIEDSRRCHIDAIEAVVDEEGEHSVLIF